MPLNLASPGIVVKEIDLTIGAVGPSANITGAIVGAFAQGPVEEPTLIENENDLLKVFGQSYSLDKQYETWLTASSYLAYGGNLRVVRSDDTDLRNAAISNVGIATSIKIKSEEHYNQLGYADNVIPGIVVAARNPGSWANGLKVAIIDSKVDQILSGINTTVNSIDIQVGYGITQSLGGKVDSTSGTSLSLNGYYLKGVVTEVGTGKIGIKVLSRVSSAGTETAVDYQYNGVYCFTETGNVAIHTNGISVSYGSTSYTSETDWYDEQSISLSNNTTIAWNSLAERPNTSAYAAARGSRFDEVHVVVIDDLGTVTGNAGSILEKHVNLSKGSDAEFSVGSPAYWRKYLVNNSNYIFGGGGPSGLTTTGFEDGNFDLTTDNTWDQNVDGIIFGATGSKTYTLGGGVNYNGQSGITTSGALTATLSGLKSGYSLFENKDDYQIDFLLMGSANHPIDTARELANHLIRVAELRKDAIAFISPYRASALTDTSSQTAVNINSAEDITANVISFYASVASSSYAVFDSGYKYMYDRFSDTFKYIPLNGDIAGLCARTDINVFPWYSPAGTARGAILNAVKLAYNPSKTQRDRLYSSRINPVIFSPGSGIILFGDKTGFAKSSAFNRINVRRLFLYLEEAISAAAKDQLFEFNDEITRTNFVNIIEPFLRDVQAKRGIFDYVVICDETNNTASVIDNNEFVADIYVKPARSINFIGLNFVATKTGVDFEEVIGNF